MKLIIGEEVVQTIPYKRGKPSSYHPKMCEIVIRTAEIGGFEAAMCINCGISISTFKKYIKEYEEFAEAVEFAKLITLKLQEEILVAGSLGQIEGYNFKANEKILSSKYRELYGKEDKDVNTITVNNISLTVEQMQEKISQKLEKLKFMGQVIDTNPIPSTQLIETESKATEND